MILFNKGRFVLHSGKKSKFKIDCDALTDADYAAIIMVMLPHIKPFSDVYGIPIGGTKLARFLYSHRNPRAKRFLIVDDVLTTGNSITKAICQYEEMDRYADHEVFGAVIFARGYCPMDVYAFCCINEEEVRK